ncbi:hypothetical protein CALVIDRAFT_525565 [Calocera viscosa TUFC12733]|uniref:Uncharacterized protein n=1 Tax=Calocera viscosa (strain TUFC12733) TaxID=1330018 RepID=A0A167PQ62_CALVF|nr:hypothetical protein CALVIDRAFT_525565 [Calocera viscosa TUFC12733]
MSFGELPAAGMNGSSADLPATQSSPRGTVGTVEDHTNTSSTKPLSSDGQEDYLLKFSAGEGLVTVGMVDNRTNKSPAYPLLSVGRVSHPTKFSAGEDLPNNGERDLLPSNLSAENRPGRDFTVLPSAQTIPADVTLHVASSYPANSSSSGPHSAGTYLLGNIGATTSYTNTPVLDGVFSPVQDVGRPSHARAAKDSALEKMSSITKPRGNAVSNAAQSSAGSLALVDPSSPPTELVPHESDRFESVGVHDCEKCVKKYLRQKRDGVPNADRIHCNAKIAAAALAATLPSSDEADPIGRKRKFDYGRHGTSKRKKLDVMSVTDLSVLVFSDPNTALKAVQSHVASVVDMYGSIADDAIAARDYLESFNTLALQLISIVSANGLQSSDDRYSNSRL